MTANIIIEGFDVGVDISQVSKVSNEVVLELLSEQIDLSIFDNLSNTTYIEMLIGNTIKGDTGKSAYQSYLDTTTDNPPLSESAWANLFGDKLDVDGNGSDTTVTFAEAGTTALPATGEKQSILWGKALRYLKTQIPTWLSTKVEVDGDGSTVTSDSADDADYNTEFPTQGNLWNLSAWFSLIKAKINRLFVVSTRYLTITATFDNGLWTFDPFDVSQFSRCVENAFEGSVIKIHFIGYDGGGAILIDTFFDGVFRYNAGIGIEYIDCFNLSRTFYIDSEAAPMNAFIDGYLYTNGNSSDTTVNFAEEGVTALPASGEKQSVLWGKVLRYLKTVIPASLSAKIDIQGGDATNAASASNASMTYDQTWPTYVTKWSLLNWFGAIRAKIDRLFDVKLNTTGNGSNTTVAFTEAVTESLPATGETQATLWGKALYYIKKLNQFATDELAKVKQVTGTSTTDVLSQNAVAVYYEPKARATSQISRIEADGGLVRNKSMLYKLMQEQADLMPSCDLLYIPECGVKTRTIAATSTTPPYVYVPKLYDLIGSNDAAQTTESLQPFLGGNIAPNEKYRLNGNSAVKSMTLGTAKALTFAQKWSFTFAINKNSIVTSNILSGTSNTISISISGATMALNVDSVESAVKTINLLQNFIGRNAIITLTCDGVGNIFVYAGGILMGSTTVTTTDTLNLTTLNAAEANYLYWQFHTKQLSTSEVSILHSQLRGYFPEIESITIGNQVWSTSNLDLACDAIGGVIPEVQLNTSGAELVAGGDFEAGLIGTKLDEKGSVSTWDLNTINPISGTRDGRLIITTSSINRPRLQFACNTLAKPHIFSFNYRVNSGVAIIYGVYNGSVINIINQSLTGSGTFTFQFLSVATTAINLYFGNSLCDIQIDNVSVKEAGWADLTVPAWCHSNNLTENGAVFGKLYNGYASLQLAANCPKGWRIPNYYDFVQLQTYLGGSAVAGGKLKSVGSDYWRTPNTGATNENGLSLVGSGSRAPSTGAFGGIKHTSRLVGSRTLLMTEIVYNGTDFIIWQSEDAKFGRAIRLIRNSPAGEQVSEVSTGLITTDIASAYKQVTISFGYRIKSITCTSATNLTGVAANAYTAGGTLIQNLITGKTAAANVPMCYAIGADQSVQYADYTVRITATGVTSAGALFQIQIEKILL